MNKLFLSLLLLSFCSSGFAKSSFTSVATCRAKAPKSDCKIEFFDEFPGTISWKSPGAEDVSPNVVYRLHASNCFTSEGWPPERDLLAPADAPTQITGVDFNGPPPRALDSILEAIQLYEMQSSPFTQEKLGEPIARVGWIDGGGFHIDFGKGLGKRIPLICQFLKPWQK